MKILFEDIKNNWDIVDLRFDFKEHTLTLFLECLDRRFWQEEKRSVKCEKVVSIRYGSWVNESPPWHLHQAPVEEISNEDVEKELNGLGFKPTESISSLGAFGPYYRLTISGDSLATVICRNVVPTIAPRRIYVDFNSPYGAEKVPINSQKDIDKGMHFGVTVTLYCEEMEVQAVLKYDDQLKMCFGIPDWSTKRDLTTK